MRALGRTATTSNFKRGRSAERGRGGRGGCGVGGGGGGGGGGEGGLRWPDYFRESGQAWYLKKGKIGSCRRHGRGPVVEGEASQAAGSAGKLGVVGGGEGAALPDKRWSVFETARMLKEAGQCGRKDCWKRRWLVGIGDIQNWEGLLRGQTRRCRGKIRRLSREGKGHLPPFKWLNAGGTQKR